MKLKQKAALFSVISGVTLGLLSAILLAALPGSVASAQSAGACSTVPSGWSSTLAACEEAVKNDKDPCAAIYSTLKADGNDRAEEIRTACKTEVACSTVPGGWDSTRAACEEAVKNGKDPCAAIYDTLKADGNSEAESRRSACQAVAGSKGRGECTPGEAGCCAGVKTSIISGDVCNESGDGVVFSLLKWVLRLMTAGVGVAAVGGIGYGALLYTTAENKPDQTKKAIGIITNVVIGIVAYALMAVLLNFLIPGGVIG